MKSPRNKFAHKVRREYFQKKSSKYLESIISSFKWLYRYSGLKYIYNKFNLLKNSRTLPIGFFWLSGMYIVLFGVASHRYENRIKIIENRAIAIFAQLAVPSLEKMVFSRIPGVQNMLCPYKPNLLNPLSIFFSLFKDRKYEAVSAHLMETIEHWKNSLDSVNLSEAILRNADLRDANFTGANLSRADLQKAKLQKANLQDAILQETDFQNANLRGANLQRADLRRADLQGTDLQDTLFQGANLQYTNLRRANLQRASLLGANLQNASLLEADFHYTNLWGADLRQANLQGANLRNAFLQGANLQNADLGGAKEVTVEQLCKASILYETKLDRELERQIKHECSDLLKEPPRADEDTSDKKTSTPID